MNAIQPLGKKWWRATFSVFSTSLTHQEISDRLGLQPTRTHTKGQPRGARRTDGSIDLSNVWQDSAWQLTSPLGRDRILAEHINWLLDTIEPKADAIKALRTECSLIRLFCGFASHDGQGGFTLDTDTLGRMSELGLNLELDLYPPSDPEVIEDEPEGMPTTIVQ
ncbi:MAG: DUF4279 domain-containing protein [Candidatus Sulfotelmatobacter sp.]